MWVLYVALGVVAALVITVFVGAWVVVKKNFEKEKDWEKYRIDAYDKMRREGKGELLDAVLKGQAYLASLPCDHVYITSYDGLKLHARYYKNGESKRTVVMVHGYKSMGNHDFAVAFEFYRSLGLNFLIIDQRSHQQSEGKYICYGVKERYDVRDWCRYLEREHADESVILSGISMGCATVLMAAGLDDMPGNVIGIIADCGYTSPYDEFRHVCRDSMHLPVFPMLPVADLICRMRCGFAFKEASTIDAVKKIRVPVLFVHGEADDFVLPEFTKRNYEACASEKKTLVLVPGAEHGLSYVVDTPRCQKIMKEFVEGL